MTVSALAKILYYPYETSTSVDLPHTDEEPVTEFKPLDQYSPFGEGQSQAVVQVLAQDLRHWTPPCDLR